MNTRTSVRIQPLDEIGKVKQILAVYLQNIERYTTFLQYNHELGGI